MLEILVSKKMRESKSRVSEMIDPKQWFSNCVPWIPRGFYNVVGDGEAVWGGGISIRRSDLHIDIANFL